jgi:AraC-like DNA-binding protein
LTVREVAELVGSTNLSAFSSRFTQQVGVPHSEYRRRTVERGGLPPVGNQVSRVGESITVVGGSRLGIGEAFTIEVVVSP